MKRILRHFFTVALIIALPAISKATVSPSFTVSILSNFCNSVFASFTNTSTGTGITSIQYVFGDGSSSSVTTLITLPVNHSYTTTGTTDGWFNVTINVWDASGTLYTYTIDSAVHVFGQPTVHFSDSSRFGAGVTEVCPNTTMYFRNTTSDSGVVVLGSSACTPSWQWTIDGTTFTGERCSYTFTTPGVHIVTLVESSACGCTGFSTQTITVDEVPRAYFTRDSVACDHSTPLHFYDSSYYTSGSGIISHVRWHFGTSTSTGSYSTLDSPTHVFSGTGWSRDSLIVYSPAGCADTFVRIYDVYVQNFRVGFTFTSDTFCAGSTVTFVDTTIGSPGTSASGNTSFWRFNNGSTSSSSSPSTVFYNSLTTPVTYYVVDSEINFYTGCHGIDSIPFVINPRPVINWIHFDSVYKCHPTLLTHFSTSVSGGGVGIDSLRWSFGDSHSTTTNPNTSFTNPTSHLYTYFGTYSISLHVRDSNSCTIDTTLSNLIKIDSPVFTMTIDPSSSDSGCALIDSPFHFIYHTSLSYTGSGTSSHYILDHINYGDGTPDVTVDLGYHVYTYTGTTGWDYINFYYHLPDSVGGCTYHFRDSVLIGNLAPTFSVTMTGDSLCPNSIATFIAHCTNCTSEIWTLAGTGLGGAGSSSDSTDTATVSYTAIGRHNIVLLLDRSGCSITLDTFVYIRPPSATITVSTPRCDSPLVFSFTGSGFGATGFHWDFGDGTTGTGFHIRHTFTPFSDTQTFYVALVDSNLGHTCTNTDTVAIHIYPMMDSAIFNVSDTNVCKYQSIHFHAHSNAFGLYSQYIWNLGNGVILYRTDTGFNYSYSTAGTYTVTLRVGNAYGCDTTSLERIVIHVSGPQGGIRLSDTLGCSPLTVTFLDSNLMTGGATLTHRGWCFNYHPGTNIWNQVVPLTRRDTTLSYTTGYYTIVLADTDNVGCRSWDSAHVRVVKPHAYFTISDTVSCIGLSNTFSDTNSHCSYFWNFDGTAWNTGLGQTPTHIYTANGTYTVTAAIVTLGSPGMPVGCVDTVSRVIHVATIHDTFALSAYSSACPGLIVLGSNYTIPTTYNFRWEIRDTSIHYDTTWGTSSYYVPLVYTFRYAGDYQIILIDSTASGCKGYDTQMVHIGGPTGTVTVSADSGCAPLSATFCFHPTYDTTGSHASFYWSLGDTTFANTNECATRIYRTAPVIFYPDQFQLLISSTSCPPVLVNWPQDTIRTFVYPTVTTNHPTIVCKYLGDTLRATATGDIISSYLWTPSASLSCPTCSSTLANPLVTTIYTVTVTSIHGCSSDTTVRVAIDSNVSVVIHGADSICIGNCTKLYATGVYDGLYVWTPGTGLSCTECDTVNACPLETQHYRIIAQDLAHCPDTGFFTLVVNPLPIITYTPDSVVLCKGQPGKMVTGIVTNTPTATWRWYPNVFISNDSIVNPIVYDTSNLIYKLYATSIYGCTDSINVPVSVLDSSLTYISPDTVICVGQSIRIWAGTNKPQASFQWLDSISMTAAHWLNNDTLYDPIATPPATTTYAVKIFENTCFSAVRYTTVTVVPYPALLVPTTKTIIAGSAIQLSVIVSNGLAIKSYEWRPVETLNCRDCSDPIAIPTVTTVYTVTVTSIHGCTTEDSVRVILVCDNSQVFIPNTFTPNGDGNNDIFFVSGKGLGLIKNFSVYNRWGEEVFHTENVPANDPSYGWNGTYKGQIVEPDVFVYIATIYCELGEPFKFSGDISLIR